MAQGARWGNHRARSRPYAWPRGRRGPRRKQPSSQVVRRSVPTSARPRRGELPCGRPLIARSQPVAPSPETIFDGTYAPLSRPLFIYVNATAAAFKPEVKEFINFYLKNAPTLVKEVKKLASYRFTPIIMLTTESQEAKKLEGQAAGAKAWVVKPFQPAQMLAAVSKLILP